MDKLIWFAGIPSSGKTTMAMRLEFELEWAGKKAMLLDDEQIKFVPYSEIIKKVLDLIGQEYSVIVSPYPQILPRKPDLIVWCRCPLETSIERDRAKITNKADLLTEKERFIGHWGHYSIEANLILDTYDRGRKTEENIEFCWSQLKRKMEELFGNFRWRIRADNKPKISN